MKVLIVNGSSHENGTTMTAINEIIKGFEEEGVETEIFQLGREPIADCMQCHYCEKNGKCVINDQVNDFVERAKSAQGFIFATPVYYGHPSGRLLDFMDRIFYSNFKEGLYRPFMFKPAAAIAVARRSGTTASLDCLNKYFTSTQMPIAGSTYWNNVFGMVAEDAPKDEEGMQTMRNLARNMAWMMKCFKLGKEQGIPLPESEHSKATHFIR